MQHDLVRTRQVGRHFCGRCAAGFAKSLGTYSRTGVKFLHSVSLRSLCARGVQTRKPFFWRRRHPFRNVGAGKCSERVSGTQVHVLRWGVPEKKVQVGGLGMACVVVVGVVVVLALAHGRHPTPQNDRTGQGPWGLFRPLMRPIIHRRPHPLSPPQATSFPPTTTTTTTSLSKLVACGPRSSYPSGNMAVTERACERSAQAHCQLQLVDDEPFLLRRILPRRERGSLLPPRQAVAIVQR